MKPRIVATLASGLLVVSAMGVSAQSPAASMAPMGLAAASMAPAGSMTPGAIDSPAANLRTTLDLKLGEHIILALKATDAALNGNTDLFGAYGKLLNTNGTDIGAMIGSVYGKDAEDRSTPSGAPTTATSWTTPRASRPRTRQSRTRRSPT